jgi:hypothetical protein
MFNLKTILVSVALISVPLIGFSAAVENAPPPPPPGAAMNGGMLNQPMNGPGPHRMQRRMGDQGGPNGGMMGGPGAHPTAMMMCPDGTMQTCPMPQAAPPSVGTAAPKIAQTPPAAAAAPTGVPDSTGKQFSCADGTVMICPQAPGVAVPATGTPSASPMAMPPAAPAAPK